MREAPHVLGIVLAGGEGKRLYPLTADRAKPAVPFGGAYRLIDFVLSNLVNARYLRICVLTQYKSHSLDRHISQNWRLSGLAGEYITPVPAQQRLGPRWYTGSADAIYQSLNLIYDEDPDYIVVFGADHVYRMDPEQMVQLPHRERRRRHGGRDPGAARRGERVRLHRRRRVRAHPQFLEKPPTRRARPTIPRPRSCRWATTSSPPRCSSTRSAPTPTTTTPITTWVATSSRGWSPTGMAAVYDFSDNEVPGATERDRGYWRDVGTLDAFYDAHMDLVSVHPVFNLYNRRWPIRGASENLAPAKFVNGGSAQESVVGAGSIISAASVRNSVLSSNVVIDDGAIVEGSVIMPGVRVGRGAVVRHAILDKNVVVGPGEMVGVDLEKDRERFSISAGGVVAVGKGVWI